MVTTTIKSRITNYSEKLNFFVLPKLTAEIPLLPVKRSSIKIQTDWILGDPYFGTLEFVDVIVGTEIFYNLISKGQIRSIKHGLVLQNT